MPFERVVISSSSAGSYVCYFLVRAYSHILEVKYERGATLQKRTFWIPSTMVAYFLFAIDARGVCAALHAGSARDNAREEDDLSILYGDIAVACQIFGRR